MSHVSEILGDEVKARNEAIVAEWLAGSKRKALARKYCLSPAYIGKIVARAGAPRYQRPDVGSYVRSRAFREEQMIRIRMRRLLAKA